MRQHRADTEPGKTHGYHPQPRDFRLSGAASPKPAKGFVDPADCTNIRTTAKELGVPEKQFTRYLEEKKYLFRDKNRKLFPRAVKKSAGLFLVRDFYTDRGKLGHYTLITPAGKRHFLERTDEILFE